MKKLLFWLSSFCLGIGSILIASPIALYWFIHGDHARYIWIINGPFPFSHLGGGPFQLFAAVMLLASGVLLVAISWILSRAHSSRKKP